MERNKLNKYLEKTSIISKKNTERIYTIFILLFYLFSLLYTYVKYVYPLIEMDNAVGRESSMLIGIFVFLGCLLFILLLLSYYNLRKERSLEKSFAPIALMLGIIYIFLIPVLLGPDETRHAATAYAYSNELLRLEMTDGEGKTLARGEDTHKNIGYKAYPTRENFETEYGNLLSESRNEGAGTLRKPMSTPVYLYIPYIIGITAGRILNLSGVQMFLLARFLGLLSYVGIVYVAIKRIPFGKGMLFLIACMPMSIQQGAMISYDMMVNAFSFLFFAQVIYLAFEKEKVVWKDYFILIFAMVVIIPVKIVYIFLTGLMFLIPMKKFQKKSCYYIGFAGVFFAGIIVSMLLQQTATADLLTSANNTVPWGDEPAYTMSYILDHPLDIIGKIIYTFKSFYRRYLGTTIGMFLGRWTAEIEISSIYIYGYLMLLLIAAIGHPQEKQPFHWKNRMWCYLLCIGVVGATALSMILSYTSIYSPVIQGIQGRYFIPIMPIALLTLRNFKLQMPQKADKKLIMAGMCIQVPILLNLFCVIMSR